MRKYYTEQTMESIARRVLDAYDERLYRGQPRAIPIEDLIERHGLTLEFQYLRKNGRIDRTGRAGPAAPDRCCPRFPRGTAGSAYT